MNNGGKVTQKSANTTHSPRKSDVCGGCFRAQELILIKRSGILCSFLAGNVA
jgi:hypothetical protein